MPVRIPPQAEYYINNKKMLPRKIHCIITSTSKPRRADGAVVIEISLFPEVPGSIPEGKPRLGEPNSDGPQSRILFLDHKHIEI